MKVNTKLVPNDFMVLISSFKVLSSIKHDIYFVNYGPVYFEINDKVGYALGRDYLVIDRLLPWRAVVSWSSFPERLALHSCAPATYQESAQLLRSDLSTGARWFQRPRVDRPSTSSSVLCLEFLPCDSFVIDFLLSCFFFWVPPLRRKIVHFTWGGTK